MSVLSNFEGKVEGAVDGAAAAMFSSPIEPAQIAKKAEKQMKKEKLVGSGRQYAPTLYNVLVNNRDNKRLFGFYPTMASEIENYLYAKGTEAGMEFDIRPLVRFIPDPGLKKSRFEVIAEVVSAPIIRKLREEEMEYYGLAPAGSAADAARSDGVADLSRGAGAGVVGAAAGGVVGAGAAAARDYGFAASPQGNRDSNEDYSAPPASGKFAGLSVPAQIDDVSEFSDLPPLGQGKPPLNGLSDPGARPSALSAGAPGQSAFQQNAAPLTEKDLEAAPALGQATLYNPVEQRSYSLRFRTLTIGRGKDNVIVVADANASRVHTRLSQDATGKWKVTDLDSTNGTLLNGRPVTSAILRHGDEVIIGTTMLRFSE